MKQFIQGEHRGQAGAIQGLFKQMPSRPCFG